MTPPQRTILLEVSWRLILEREELVGNIGSQLPATNTARNPDGCPWKMVSVIPICFSSSKCKRLAFWQALHVLKTASDRGKRCPNAELCPHDRLFMHLAERIQRHQVSWFKLHYCRNCTLVRTNEVPRSTESQCLPSQTPGAHTELLVFSEDFLAV